MMKDKPSIESEVSGPYLVKNLKDFRNSKGGAIETYPVMALCSCGGSRNKPLCDGTHKKIGFTSDKAADRIPDILDTYVGKRITVYDNSGVCARAGYCTDHSPAVFNDQKKPWIDPDADDPEKTARTIRMCPSGALSYRKDGVHHKDQDRAAAITISKNGPYNIVGGIEFSDPKGSKPESKEHYTLCRCGSSRNKPFCTGEHKDIAFNDYED
jgi:CDGSH-type Zn-finger protein